MNRILLSVVALVVTATSFAAPDPFDQQVANFQLLQDKAIQKELGISEGQRNKMNSVAGKYQSAMKALQDQAVKDKSGKPNPALQKKATESLIGLRNDVLKQLSDGQLKRLRELTLQLAGKRALLDPNVAKKVGLSSSQSKSLTESFKSGASKLQALQAEAYKALEPKWKDKKPKNNEEAKKFAEAFQKELAGELAKRKGRATALEQEFDKKMTSIVTPAQWKSLEALRGKPFKLPK